MLFRSAVKIDGNNLLREKITELYATREFGKAIREIMSYSDVVNHGIDNEKPWELAKRVEARKALHASCSDAINAFRHLTIYLKPILPKLAEVVEDFLNIPPLTWADLHTALPDGHVIKPYSHLMTRVEEKQLDKLFEIPKEQKPVSNFTPAPAAEKAVTPAPTPITIDDFAKVDLRIAKIQNAEHVEIGRAHV